MRSSFYLSWTVVALLGGLSDPQTASAQESKSKDLYGEALALARVGKLAEAQEPLDRLLAQTNDRLAQLLMFRANLRAQTGRFQDAASDLEQVVQINPSNHAPWSTLAPLLVQTGDLAKYRIDCKEMLRRFNDTTEAPIANRIAKSCLLAPSALDAADVTLAAKLADKSVALTKEGEFWPWRSMTQGLADYRRGEFARASELIDLFQKQLADAQNSGALSGNWDTCKADGYFISAMAHHQLKETEQTRAALEKGRVIVRTKLPGLNGTDLGLAWWDVLMSYILMDEAGTMPGVSGPGQP
jgi:tetratricopeptide (TPR) repeat protein